MKIHFFVRTMNEVAGGGSHHNSIAYVRALRKGGHAVEVHVLYPEENAFPSDISPIVHQGFGLGHFGERALINKLLKQYESDADIFFLYSAEFMWGGGVYRRSGGTKPVVVYLDACLPSMRTSPARTLSYWWYQLKRWPWDKTIGLRDIRFIDRFLPCSPAIKDIYITFGFPKDAFTVLPNIVPNMASTRMPRDKKELIVLYVGRLVYIKGVDLLVEAMARLKEYRARLVIVGDGDMRAAIEKRLIENGLTAEMPGWVPENELGTYFARADIFAHPTRCFDAAPRTVVGALQWGLPSVVPDTGGAAWIAGEAGLVYRTSDRNALTNALRTLFDSAELRAKLSAQTEREATKFDERMVYPQLEQILLTAIEEATRV